MTESGAAFGRFLGQLGGALVAILFVTGDTAFLFSAAIAVTFLLPLANALSDRERKD